MSSALVVFELRALLSICTVSVRPQQSLAATELLMNDESGGLDANAAAPLRVPDHTGRQPALAVVPVESLLAQILQKRLGKRSPPWPLWLSAAGATRSQERDDSSHQESVDGLGSCVSTLRPSGLPPPLRPGRQRDRHRPSRQGGSSASWRATPGWLAPSAASARPRPWLCRSPPAGCARPPGSPAAPG